MNIESLIPPAEQVAAEPLDAPPDAIDELLAQWDAEDLVAGVDPAVIATRQAERAQWAIEDAAFKEAEFAKLRTWLAWLHAEDDSPEPPL